MRIDLYADERPAVYTGPESKVAPKPLRLWNDPPDPDREKLDLARGIRHRLRQHPNSEMEARLRANVRNNPRAVELLGRAVIEAGYPFIKFASSFDVRKGACRWCLAFAVARVHNWPAPELNEYTSLVLGPACRTCLLTLGHLRARRLGELAERVHGPEAARSAVRSDASPPVVAPTGLTHRLYVDRNGVASLRHPDACDGSCPVLAAFGRTTPPIVRGIYPAGLNERGRLVLGSRVDAAASRRQRPADPTDRAHAAAARNRRPASADFTESEVLRMAGLA
jgi:hypothetical protein